MTKFRIIPLWTNFMQLLFCRPIRIATVSKSLVINLNQAVRNRYFRYRVYELPKLQPRWNDTKKKLLVKTKARRNDTTFRLLKIKPNAGPKIAKVHPCVTQLLWHKPLLIEQYTLQILIVGLWQWTDKSKSSQTLPPVVSLTNSLHTDTGVSP